MVLVRFRETATRKCLSSCRIGQQQPAAWIYRNTRTPPRHEGRLLEDGVGTKLPERRHGHANSRKRWVTRNSFYVTKNKCGALFVSQFPIFFPPPLTIFQKVWNRIKEFAWNWPATFGSAEWILPVYRWEQGRLAALICVSKRWNSSLKRSLFVDGALLSLWQLPYLQNLCGDHHYFPVVGFLSFKICRTRQLNGASAGRWNRVYWRKH